MKNVWVQLSQKRNPKNHINAWLESVIASADADELAYALYSIVNVTCKFYGITDGTVTLLADKDDVVQECVLVMLKFLDNDDPKTRVISIFAALLCIAVKELNDFSIGFTVQDNDYDKIIKLFYRQLRKDKKV